VSTEGGGFPRTKSEWQVRGLQPLPHEHEIVARDTAISAQYARWYLEDTDLQWAGMGEVPAGLASGGWQDEELAVRGALVRRSRSSWHIS